jgi:hypothetical protein
MISSYCFSFLESQRKLVLERNKAEQLKINRLQAELDECKLKLENSERILYEFVQNVRGALFL